MSKRRKAGKCRRMKGVGAETRTEAWAVRIGPQQNMLRTVAQAERSHDRAVRCYGGRLSFRHAPRVRVFRSRKRRYAFSKASK